MAKIIIICDFHQHSGFGHLTRMKSLANSFEKNFHNVKFIFEKKYKKFNEKYVSGYNREYLNFNKKNNLKKTINYLKRNSIDIIIFDSYNINSNLQSKLYENFFIVSFDDKLQNYKSHLIFNSKESVEESNLRKKENIWKIGKKFLLIGDIRKKKFNKNIKKVLIHAGGTSKYNHFKKFLFETLLFLKNKNLKISFLYRDLETFYKINELVKALEFNKNKIKFIKNNKNFSKSLNKFDLIVGPSGITTYEAIASQVLPISFTIFDDGRDDVFNWNLFGNIIHLKKSEIINKKIVNEIWEFVFKNYNLIYKNLIKKSKNTKDNSKNVCREIIKYYENQNKPQTNNLKKYEMLKIKKAKFEHIRMFLYSRNKPSVRKVSSNPKHIITFPEHLNWWINNKIKKFVLIKNNITPVAYHWIKEIKEFGKQTIIISGWFPDFRDNNLLRSSKIILNHQSKFIKKNYNGAKWIINISNKNLFSLKLNYSIGFKKANKYNIKMAQKIFKINLKKFSILEMDL